MRFRLGVLGVGVVAACVSTASPVRAQDARCTDPRFVGAGELGGDACQKVVDIYNYMNGELGTLVSGGNATLGQSGSLGGLGHFAISVRANAMSTAVPDIQQVGVALSPVGAPEMIPTNDNFVPLPNVDVAVGLFKGFPIGLSHVGGVDLLVSATALPGLSLQSIDVATPDGSLDFGVGVRVALLDESLVAPGVAVTYFRRDLPRTTITATAGSTSSVTVQDYQIKTSAWRLVAGKSFLAVGVVAGIGQDRYEGRANLTYNVDGTRPEDPIILDAAPTRTNAFLDASVNILALKLVGEVGRVWGGDVTTYNTFAPGSSDARWYGSLGLRVGL